LSSAEAAARLVRYGPNRLPQAPPPSLAAVLVRQFRSPLIYILALAALVSVAIGEVQDAGFIAAVLCLNAAVGAAQEWKAERASHALRRLLRVRATVERDGEARDVDAEDVVPGDIVWLESGSRVPADLRLLSAQGLQCDESLLTGESLPVHKDAGWRGPEALPLADRKNLTHAGTTVTHGRAKGVAVATGAATAVGELALDVLSAPAGKPPLLVRMESFTNAVAVWVLAAAAAIAVAGVAAGRYGAAEMFLFAVALAVAVIPEGLPVAMTVALAVATSRMARRGVIVRRLTAVEGLGSCTYIATDKTGTLTVNELTARELWLPSGETFRISGEGFAPHGQVLGPEGTALEAPHPRLEALARAVVLSNEGDLRRDDGGWTWRGDAVDVALLSLGRKLGLSREAELDRCAERGRIPFEPEHRFAASYHEVAGELRVFVKGAPERVLAMCSDSQCSESQCSNSQRSDAQAPALRSSVEEAAHAMAARGLRVLAVAEGGSRGGFGPEDLPPPPEGLALLGLVGMLDPLRPGAAEAVRRSREAGIRVVMVTGDHRVTALAVARELGLASSDTEVVSGDQLQAADAVRLGELVQTISVFARVTPHQKLEVVEAARRAGHFVAVTGDGANDAPALRTANIGVAMGRSGTDVAREAAELVISDDDFSTIVAGVEEGRIAYDNLRKVIYLLVSTGAAELVLMGFAVVAGLPYLPLLPVQLLWVNLVTDGIQVVALGFEPGEGDTLRRRPRPPQEPIFNRLMVERSLLAAAVIGALCFFVFRAELPDGAGPDEAAAARNTLLLLLVLFENFHLGNCRSETKSALKFSPLRSPVLLAGAVGAFLVHVAAMHLPFAQEVLGTRPLSLSQWAFLAAVAVTIVPVMEVHKWSWARRSANRDSRAEQNS
jgi:magnesium-transporting ATPase (P-type)